tara:strand:- start:4414 stop:4833 length:420 start_codon:yes stop_codon:yes gene_type:complete
LPIDPSSLTRWRKRIGEEGVELLLAVTIEEARAAGLIKRASLDKVIVDTTVMPKAIANPTDSRLLERSRQHMAKFAQDHGPEPAPELQPQGAPPGHAGGPLRPCQAVQAHARRHHRMSAKLPGQVQAKARICCSEWAAS